MKKAAVVILFSFIAVVLIIATVSILSQHYFSKQKEKIVIGIINPNPGTLEITSGFVEGLAGHGYEPGKNLTLIRCENDAGIDTALQKMLSEKVDLIFTVTTPATRRAEKATANSNIPIIFVMNRPVESGVISSLSHPGGRLTGIQVGGSSPKALEWILNLFPGISNIFVPIKFDTRAARQSLSQFQESAELLGVGTRVAEVDDKEELAAVLSELPADAEVIFLLHSILITSHASEIAEAAIEKKMLTAAAVGECAEGILLCFSSNHNNTGRQASRLAHQVLTGADPGDTPSEIAEFFLTINLKTAEKLGLEIPGRFMAQADFIIR